VYDVYRRERRRRSARGQASKPVGPGGLIRPTDPPPAISGHAERAVARRTRGNHRTQAHRSPPGTARHVSGPPWPCRRAVKYEKMVFAAGRQVRRSTRCRQASRPKPRGPKRRNPAARGAGGHQGPNLRCAANWNRPYQGGQQAMTIGDESQARRAGTRVAHSLGPGAAENGRRSPTHAPPNHQVVHVRLLGGPATGTSGEQHAKGTGPGNAIPLRGAANQKSARILRGKASWRIRMGASLLWRGGVWLTPGAMRRTPTTAADHRERTAYACAFGMRWRWASSGRAPKMAPGIPPFEAGFAAEVGRTARRGRPQVERSGRRPATTIAQTGRAAVDGAPRRSARPWLSAMRNTPRPTLLGQQGRPGKDRLAADPRRDAARHQATFDEGAATA